MRSRSVAMVVVYRNPRTGEFLLQHNCLHPDGGYSDYGPPAPISEKQLREEFSELVFDSLAMCGKRTFGEVQYHEPEGFETQHDAVYIVMLENGMLEISAGRKTRGGYEAPVVATVSEDEARTRMTELIDAAFKLAR